MKSGIEDLVELPRRVIQQRVQTPNLVEGGDCGACVLGGLLRMPILDVYEKLQKREDGKPPQSFNHYSMIDAIKKAHYKYKIVDRFITDIPTWAPVSESMRAWGDPSWMRSGEWFKYVTMAFEAGYYAITAIQAQAEGPFTGGTNHWVMLCGSRLHWENGAGSHEILMSCSSRKTPDEEWVEAGPFLQKRGGFCVFLVKPSV